MSIYQRAVLDVVPQARPALDGAQPGHVRGRSRQPADHVLWVQALAGQGEAPPGFIGAMAIWLWFTVLFANFSEALAEGRGKAQAEALRKTRQETSAKKLDSQPLKAEPPDEFQS